MNKALLVLLAGFAAALTGCWDIKAIQDTNYVTAIGCDYEDGQFVVYAQMLDFANVAKSETGKTNKPASIWSGHEKGSTVIEAMNRLYQTSQQRMFWGQVSSVVFTERALEHGIAEFFDGLIRYREMRYTQWVYGTKEPIDRVFMALPFFNQSPLGSILHHPEDNYRQRSYIRPLRLYRAVSLYREPGTSLLLPSLVIADRIWKEGGEKNDPKLTVDGIYAIYKQKRPVWVPNRELAGLRWLDRDTQRSNVTLIRNGKPAASVSVDDPKASVTPALGKNGLPTFQIRVRSQFVVQELLQNMSAAEINNLTVREIVSEIGRTYDYGKKHGIDLYQLNHHLYRKKFAAWRDLTQTGRMPLTGLEIDRVQVELTLTHTGMYKLKDHGGDY